VCVAVCVAVRVAVCCSVLQCVAVYVAVYFGALQCVAVCCSEMQRVLHCVAVNLVGSNSLEILRRNLKGSNQFVFAQLVNTRFGILRYVQEHSAENM